MLSRFHLILKRHGQTDRQTDRIAISISRISVLMRYKNENTYSTKGSYNNKLISRNSLYANVTA